MYEITRSCSKGDLKKCICHKKKEFHQIEFEKKHINNPKTDLVKKAYEWSGCSDNVIFGYKLSKTFVDSDEKIINKNNEHFLDAAKPNKLMNIHNNEVGRRIILKNMKQVCKCHGVSGSCSIKVCWKVMPEFRKIGNEIMKLYDAADRINTPKRRDQVKQLRQIVLSRFSRNTKSRDQAASATHRNSLIYIDKSPNFCRKIQKNGIIGTSKRMCSHSNELNSNSTKSGFMVVHEKCEHLCCGKGFHSKVVEIEEDCECAFQWCCSVKCKKCKKKVVQYFCN